VPWTLRGTLQWTLESVDRGQVNDTAISRSGIIRASDAILAIIPDYVEMFAE
jgi:hypothetical protein